MTKPPVVSAPAPESVQPPSADQSFLAGVLDSTRRVGNFGTWSGLPDSGIALWSPEMYTMLRLPPGSGEEPIERFQSLVIAEDQPAIEGILQALRTSGFYAPTTLRMQGGDGTIRHLISSGQRTPTRAGEAVSYVGINIDVTQQVEERSRLAAAEARLARHASVIESLLENVPVGIAVSVDDEITLLSRYAADMVGMTTATASEWDAWQIYHLDGKTPATQEQQALSRAARGETIRMEEWYIRAADGRLLLVACNAGPIRSTDGEIIGGVVAWYEISAFKEAELVERSGREAAEAAVRQREMFAATVAHELRTPLSAILGWTEVMNRNASAATIGRGVGAISISAHSMSRLLDDFLDLSRIGAGKLVLTRRPIELCEVIEATLETLGPIASAAKVVVQWDPSIVPVHIQGDALRLRQAVGNLLTNAVKYSSEGGLVLVTLAAEKGVASLRISDYGQGIDPDDLPMIFGAFFQADRSSAKRGGLGLGLTIAKYIVESHGGRISAESAGAGRGATFHVELPLREAIGRSAD